jgi:hypothetical protein
VSASKRPSTSSLRRFITSRPFVTVAELRRRFGLDEPDAMATLRRNGTTAWVGLPEREATKLQDLLDRNELGLELSVEVRAPVVVGVYPMRIARYVMDGNAFGNGHGNGHPSGNGYANGNGQPADASPTPPPAAGGGGNGFRASVDAAPPGRQHPHAPRPMSGAPTYGSRPGIAPRPPDDPAGA